MTDKKETEEESTSTHDQHSQTIPKEPPFSNEQRHQRAANGSNIGLWDWDVQNNALYCSPKLLHLLETNEKKIQSNFSFFESRLHPDDSDDVLAILNAHLEKGFDFNVEYRMKIGSATVPKNQKKTSYIWVHMRGQASWDQNNKAVHMSGSLDDITERRIMIDQLRESNESLSRFAYVCSHDLKEPARIAENFAGLLANMYADQLDKDGQEYIRYISESTKRMQQMIHDMLAYSQVENKTTAFEKVACNDELEKIIKNLALVIKEKNGQVTYSDLPEIKADRMQIFQLFQNLVNNGLKFCKAKTPKVHIGVTEDSDEWTFSVKDNGIGMEKEHTHQIFDVFKRLNHNEEYPGTGIGLSICQKIVHQHGGRIWVESTHGKGSTFYFTIPKKLIKRQVNDVIALRTA